MVNEKFIEFMKSFERERQDFNLYVTFEHVIAHVDDLKAVAYEGDNGIKSLLEYLVRAGWEAVEEDHLLIGCDKDNQKIRIGVGGQLAWTFGPFMSIGDLDQAYLNFMEVLFEELKRRELILLATGHQPVSKASEIETVPTVNNKCLMDYIGDNEKLADYFKCSAKTSVSLQYAHVDNFEKRYQAAAIIQPALATLFDNSAWVNGKENEEVLYNLNNLASADWSLYHMEDAMSESFKYQDFIDFVLQAPAISTVCDDGRVCAANMTVEEAYKDGITQDEIIRVLSNVRPMVSMNEYGLTITNVDTVPYPLNMAYVLIIRGLLYNTDNITAIQKMIEELKEENLEAAHQGMLKEGLKASIGSGTTYDMIKDLFFMTTLTVGPSEQHYLQPITSLLFKDITTKKVSARQFANMISNV